MRPLKGTSDSFPLVAPNSLVHSPIHRCNLETGPLPLTTVRSNEGTLKLTHLGIIIQLDQTLITAPRSCPRAKASHLDNPDARPGLPPDREQVGVHGEERLFVVSSGQNQETVTVPPVVRKDHCCQSIVILCSLLLSLRMTAGRFPPGQSHQCLKTSCASVVCRRTWPRACRSPAA